MTGPTVLHLAPHPDDELIGAPATLMALRDAGWRVVNVACSLGPVADRPRRLAELAEACARAGFDSALVPEPLEDPLAPSESGAAQRALAESLAAIATSLEPTVVVAPSPHDRHPGHEVVGRAALDVCARGITGRLWLWGLWADLPLPTLAVAVDGERLDEIVHALSAHGGELARNDYRRMVRGRAEMNASLGPERVFGFGSAASAAVGGVELLTELQLVDSRWRLGARRWLDTTDPLGSGLDPLGAPGDDVTDWVEADSVTTRFGPPGYR